MDYGFKTVPSDKVKSDVHAGSIVLDGPAGKRGFLNPIGDNFKFDDGTHFRMWGINLDSGGNFPTHANSVILADHFAKRGYNCIRIMSIDKQVSSGGSRVSNIVTAVDSTQLDKLDYFINELKKRGIYVHLSYHCNMDYQMADVDEPSNVPTNGKYLHYFYPKAETHLKEYIANIANHVNPYTGLTYKNDPSIAVMEILNEDGLLQAYMGGQLNSLASAATNLKGYYLTLMDSIYQDWLTSKYGNTAALAAAWNAKSAGPNLINSTFFSTNSGAVGTATIDGDGSNKISMTTLNGTPQVYHAAFGQYSIALQKNMWYTISFDIKGSVAAAANIVQMELLYKTSVSGSFGNYANSAWNTFKASIDITTSYVTKTLTFQCGETAILNAGVLNSKLDFAVGKYLGDLNIRNFVFREASLKGLDAGETIEARNVLRPYIFTPMDAYTPERQQDTVRFYYELEDGFNQRILNYCKDTLGIKQPITLNNWYNGSNISLLSQSRADFIDEHIYWDHPTNWDILNFTMHNKSPVSDSTKVITHQIGIQAVKNKPYIMGEVDNTFPAKYEYEFFPILVPYACLQNVQGIFKYVYSRYDISSVTEKKIYDFMDCQNNPQHHIQSIIHSIVFLKGYVSQAQTEVVLKYSKATALANYKVFNDKYLYQIPNLNDVDLPYALFAKHKVRKQFVEDGQTTTVFADVAPSEMTALQAATDFVSDTNEIYWYRTGTVTGTTIAGSYLKVNASKFQSLTGRISAQALSTSNMAVNVDIDSSVSLLSLDDKPLQTSEKMLFSLLTEQYNTGQVKNQSTGNMTDWGSYPVMFSRISTTVTITLADSTNFNVYILDTNGRKRGKAKVTKTATTITFDTSLYYTPWFLIAK